MLKKRNLFFLFFLILGFLFLTSCFLNPPVTEGILKGQVMVPEGSIQSKDLTGQALPDATVNIIDLATGAIIATTVTDATGHYQVSVPPGGPYLLEAVKDGVKLEQITCSVEVGIEYDLGTADCTTTAAALIAQAMMDAGDNSADIDCSDIIADPNFDDVSSIVCSTIQAGQDPTASAAVLQAIEDFLNPPTPPPAPPPVPTYTVTFDSQDGSAVNSQTVKQGRKVTEPTAPTKEGYTFGGWYKESVCTNAWVFATDTVTTDVTLYAKWTGSVHNITQNIYYTTIQAAFDAANNDDTIVADDGNYAESITFPDGKLIILRSLNGASLTTIIGDDNSTTVTSNNCPDGTTLEGFTITHNSGNNRGGVAIDAGYLAINNCTISNNSSNWNGGGINNLGTLDITGSTISGNSAPTGGGICNGGTLTITGSTISNNSGGGIVNGGILTIIDSIISNNSGGGIGNNGTSTISGSTISGNSTNNYAGGGIFNGNGTSTITDSTISNNSVTDSDGGGIYNKSGTLTISGSTISGNSADYDGGGIYNDHGILTITDSEISGNSAVDGGGIYIGSDTLTITDSEIYGNSAVDGGGIYIFFGSPTIQNNTISGNTASTGNGGGIYIHSGSPAIGGVDGSDTANFNTICGNTPDQINSDSYPNNYISDYCIGDTGPAGGWIFYDNGSYTTATATIPSWRYLEAAPSDQSTSAEWGCYEVLISGADGTAVGTGEQNTIDIKAGCTTANTAADICANLSLGGYDDWFLPSKDELNLMYTNLHTAVGDSVGGFVDDYYWNSSEYDDSHAWIQSFEYGGQFNSNKSGTVRIRAVRAF